MYAWAWKTRGIWGHAPLGDLLKLDALRLLLRPLWDKRRAVAAAWFAEYCIQILAVFICVCQPRWRWISTRKGTTYGWQNSIVGGDPLEGRLVNSWAPEIAICLCTYLCASFHRSSINCLRAHVLQGEQVQPNWFEQQWFTMAARLVNYLQMVGHLKCIARRCIKSFGGQKGISSEPSWNPPAYGPHNTQSSYLSKSRFYIIPSLLKHSVNLSPLEPANVETNTWKYLTQL